MLTRMIGCVAIAASAVALVACPSGTGGTAAPAEPARASAANPLAPATASAPPKVTTTLPRLESPHAAPATSTSVSVAAPNPCAHNDHAQQVIVNIHKQHAWMCAHHRAVFDSAVTTGMVGQWTNTPTGNYQIQGRSTSTVLTLNTGAQYHVKYWIPFDGPLFGFHDSPWQHFAYGSNAYKKDGSHGCVHMPLATMRFLYHWSAKPTAVHIF